ncbi:hypothetical protein DM860_006965 [Cuscuta australis]|uniref:Cysteine-rich receptor-like protein kinase 2 n=1 Tax=Cuscuta australis TaxID=267555 RepID=A0A328E9Q9_9ASTE|nr:hypothetical protein DM860_006965 [Cuscuta australis]
MKIQTIPFTKTSSLVPLLLVSMVALLLPQSDAFPRSQTIKMICRDQLMRNATVSIQSFVATMGNLSDQMRAKGWGASSMIKTRAEDDSLYGLAQCHGDLSPVDCLLCYAEARTVLPQCFPHNGGRIYLDGCFIRAEVYNFFQESLGPEDSHICGKKKRKGFLFQEATKKAVLKAVLVAPDNDGYARVESSVSGRRGVEEATYVLAECWKTLNASACKACLGSASRSMLKCLPWSEGRALYAGCFMRYSHTNFLNPVPEASERSSRVNAISSVVATLCSVIVVVMGVIIVLHTLKQKRTQKKREGSNDAKKLVKTLHDISLNIKYSTLKKATGSFHEANKLGEGGYGTVYKGVLVDGREVAVKRLFFNNRHRAADFYNEVNIISWIEHKNLVKLLGCSCSGPESLLVYELLPNQSLDRFIFDKNKGRCLNWEKRFNIIIGVAEGLAYLHENSKARIIHRDIKASNILLDSDFNAKIADFGLARSFEKDESHISTAIAGTLGYMAPEYLSNGRLTETIDVYSFGVLLLEIVMGKQNYKNKNAEHFDCVVHIAWMHFQEGTVERLIDPNLMLHTSCNANVRQEISRVVHVGLLCTQEVPSLRPSMSEVRRMLVKQEEELPPPSNPPFIDENMELNKIWDLEMKSLKEGESVASYAAISCSPLHPR